MKIIKDKKPTLSIQTGSSRLKTHQDVEEWILLVTEMPESEMIATSSHPCFIPDVYITKTYLYNFDPLKSNFYMGKGVTLFS